MNKSFNDVYLSLQIRKSKDKKTDENGNPYFEVEASNENIDLQNQIVLQRALLNSKKNFIKNGFISYDHLYKTKDENGIPVSDSRYLIGEPVDVYTEGKKTIVKGKLYKSNPLAQDIISKLKDGSKRIRASVGGLWPKVIKDRTGVEKIYEVLWNDLALTPTPVNNTVGAATLVKSMQPDEFMKALSAGYGTDSSKFKNGRALIPENIGETINIKNDLLDAISGGEIKKTKEDMTRYLLDRGIDGNLARTVVREIIGKGGNSMKKDKFYNEVDTIFKSLGEDEKKSKPEDKEELELFAEDETSDYDDNDDDDDDDKNDDEDESMKKGCKKSLDDDETVDATDLIKSLRDVISEQNDRITELEKSVEDIGNSVVAVAKVTKSIAETPNNPKSVMNKSVNNATGKNGVPTGRPSAEDFDHVKDILTKSVANDEISVMDSVRIESEVQKSMKLGTPMSADTYKFIQSKFNN